MSALPRSLASDEEVRSSLAAYYGPRVDDLRFRLLAVPLQLLQDYRLDDFDEYFEDLIENDREYDAIMLRCGEEPDWAREDAEGRYLIARDYLDAFRTGRSVRPVMLDFVSMGEVGTIHIVDGHHRTQAAHEAGLTEIAAYEVLRLPSDPR